MRIYIPDKIYIFLPKAFIPLSRMLVSLLVYETGRINYDGLIISQTECFKQQALVCSLVSAGYMLKPNTNEEK